MSCDKYSEYAILYAYDELSAEDKQSYENHLALCSRCRAEVESFRNIHSLYREVPAEKPNFSPDLLLRIKINIYAGLSGFRNSIYEFFTMGRRWLPATVATAAVIILCLVAVTRWDFQRRPERTSDFNLSPISDFDIMLDNIDYEISNIFSDESLNLETYLNSLKKNSVPSDNFFDDLETTQIDIEILSWGMEKNYF